MELSARLYRHYANDGARARGRRGVDDGVGDDGCGARWGGSGGEQRAWATDDDGC